MLTRRRSKALIANVKVEAAAPLSSSEADRGTNQIQQVQKHEVNSREIYSEARSERSARKRNISDSSENRNTKDSDVKLQLTDANGNEERAVSSEHDFKVVKAKASKRGKHAEPSVTSVHAQVDEGVEVKAEIPCFGGDCVFPFGSRSSRARMFIGAHMSISGGLENAVIEAERIGARAFALFLGSQRTWKQAPLTDDSVKRFRKAVDSSSNQSWPHIVPHASYLLNCGSPNDETYEKSREALLEAVSRCERLGIRLFNVHPGSTCGQHYPEEQPAEETACSKKRAKGAKVRNSPQQVEACLQRIADCANYVLSRTKNVTLLFENMCGQGSTVGGQLHELRRLIDLVQHRNRVGVTIDTCHMFAFGYDLRTADGYMQSMQAVEQVIGWRYVKAVHLNDSKGTLGSCLDRHENIGRGQIGLNAFRMLMNDARFENVPMVLETPESVGYDKEIALLYGLVQKD